MSLKNIEKSSPGYWLLKKYAQIFHHIHYSEIHVNGKKNIPPDAAVIFAINHENALLDALAVIFSSNRQAVFLARADIFKKAFIARILYFLKILPVYRIRDGFSSLQKNDQVFEKTIDVLRSGRPLAILPEGTHEAMKILRPFKKGMARIAFSAAEAFGSQKNVVIIPVGLEYDNYYSFRNKLVISYGIPIRIHDYIGLYRENQAVALNTLTSEVYQALEKMVIHVGDRENYDRIMQMAEFNIPDEDNILHRNFNDSVVSMKKFTDNYNVWSAENPSEKDGLFNMADEISEIQGKLRLSAKIFRQQKISLLENILQSLLLILLLPLYVYGLVFNYLPYKFPWLITRRIEDRVFHGSVRFGIWLLIFPVWYLMLFFLFHHFTKDFLYSVFFILSLPPAGLFTFHFFRESGKLLHKWKFWSLAARQDERLRRLQNLKDEFLLQLNEIVNFIPGNHPEVSTQENTKQTGSES